MYEITAKKLVPVDVKVEIKEITLLTAEEATQLPKELLEIGNWWWLRSPGIHNGWVWAVSDEGEVVNDGADVWADWDDTRPALKIVPEESLQIGERAELFGRTWTKVFPDTLLCDSSIGKNQFREFDTIVYGTPAGIVQVRDTEEDPDGNVWETSDIKVRLEQWLEEKSK